MKCLANFDVVDESIASAQHFKSGVLGKLFNVVGLTVAVHYDLIAIDLDTHSVNTPVGLLVNEPFNSQTVNHDFSLSLGVENEQLKHELLS